MEKEKLPQKCRRTSARTYSLRTTHITKRLARKTDIKIVQDNAGQTRAVTNSYAQFVKEAQIRAMQEHAL